MGWAALPITDRRWAAPLSAVALGFGLFVGVAIGPGADGTFATGATQVIELPGFGGGGDGDEAAAGEAPLGSGGGAVAQLGSPPIQPPLEEPLPTLTPLGGGESPMRVSAPDAPAVPASEEGGSEGSEPEEPLLAGTVVHVNPAAGSYTVAEEGGVMSAVHAGKLPTPGAEVEVPIRTLANGILAEAGKRKGSGKRRSGGLAGIVTFVDPNPIAPAYAVSNRGASVLVHVHPDPAGTPVELPVLGAYATVDAEIATPQPATPAAPPATPPTCAPDPALPPPPTPIGALWQRTISVGGAPFTHGDFEGIVAAVCAETGQLLISADDIREDAHDLLLTVPAAVDVSQLAVGESVAVGADIGADGSLTLTGLASDEHTKGADDEGATQGDLVPTKSDKGAPQ
jgi:hypothetical protein